MVIKKKTINNNNKKKKKLEYYTLYNCTLEEEFIKEYAIGIKFIN